MTIRAAAARRGVHNQVRSPVIVLSGRRVGLRRPPDRRGHRVDRVGVRPHRPGVGPRRVHVVRS
ncbi:hypothetical protein, partial [Nocardia ignorata]|uniref:hypothetical protein n=1 Tax=Nocardia ignorata TaxID=145285 RepID=UPI001C3F61C0